MLSALLITWREGLEAALIVGIILGYLHKLGRREQTPLVWAGVLSAAGLSALIAVLMRTIGAELTQPYEQIFEGTTMLLAVVVLTWMIFWMRAQARFLKGAVERRIDSAGTEKWGLFSLAFLSIFREGIETALFLAANAFAANAQDTVMGALLGIALAVGIGVLIYAYAVRVNLRWFFDTTSILLIVFAAGLVAHGIHEFQEIGAVPILANPAWNTEWLLPNESAIGAVLRALVGYNAAPSVLEVATYIGYWFVVVQAVRWWTVRLNTRLSQG